MSIIKNITNDPLYSKHCMIEIFTNAEEVAAVCDKRSVRFAEDQRKRKEKDFTGVENYEEARNLLATGYQATVDKLKAEENSTLRGVTHRMSFTNEIIGYNPIVPLALMNVPTCMQNSKLKPMKAKVINIYYDMTVNCGITPKQIIEAGQKLLAAIMKLEMEGYRFNLYATQNYQDSKEMDMLCVKIKDDKSPVNLKRMSFPLTHPAYFRCIGFDWYTRHPNSKYQPGFGRSIFYEKSNEALQQFYVRTFGPNTVPISCAKILTTGKEYLVKILKGETQCTQ